MNQGEYQGENMPPILWTPPSPAEEAIEDDYLFIQIALFVGGPAVKATKVGFAGIRTWGASALKAYNYALTDLRGWKVVAQSIRTMEFKPIFNMIQHEARSIWVRDLASAESLNSGQMSFWRTIGTGKWRPWRAFSPGAMATNPTPMASMSLQVGTTASPVVAYKVYKVTKN